MTINISVVEPPPVRKSGRKPRLTDEAIQDLATAVRAGNWASDHEVAASKTAAYQRAQSAMDRLEDLYSITAVTSAILPIDEKGEILSTPLEDETLVKGWTWRVGPPGPGGQVRRRRTKKQNN